MLPDLLLFQTIQTKTENCECGVLLVRKWHE